MLFSLPHSVHFLRSPQVTARFKTLGNLCSGSSAYSVKSPSCTRSHSWSFYASRRHTHSGLNSGGLNLEEFRGSLIWQALRTLGLEKDADFKTAQKAYRVLMRDNHPDKFASGDRQLYEEKQAYCVTINTAWEFVKDWLPQ